MFTEPRIVLDALILKPNMASSVPHPQVDVAEVADTTVRCLLWCVPAAVPGIAFLAGGQSLAAASALQP